MYPELNGKVALVTGAARGFGRATALRLATEGVSVIVNYRRSKSDAQNVVDEIKSAGGCAVTIRADIGDDESLHRMFETISSEFGYLDILVANAAFGIPGSMMESTKRYWDLTMSSSAWSLISLAQRAVPLMRDNWGRIISITSEGGSKVLDSYGLMGAAKGALESITRTLAVELAPKGILVNGILAGVADTKSLRSLPCAEDLILKAVTQTPVGRMLQPEDVADVIAFLSSDQARMICGQFIRVDGGLGILV
ncbi:MAG: SDR family oxidoreductase [Armatimonadota bacterium]